jgi:hypothetical protein
MKKIALFVCAVALITITCKKKEKESCSDGKMNQAETGIDCGGPCAACVSCSDGIQNQNEEDIDCGGPCTACPKHFTYSDNTSSMIQTDSSRFRSSVKQLQACLGTNFVSGYAPITIDFKAATAVNVGTFTSADLDLFDCHYYFGTSHPYNVTSATVVISSMSATQISGTFTLSILATGTSDPAKTSVTGKFRNVPILP